MIYKVKISSKYQQSLVVLRTQKELAALKLFNALKIVFKDQNFIDVALVEFYQPQKR